MKFCPGTAVPSAGLEPEGPAAGPSRCCPVPRGSGRRRERVCVCDPPAPGRRCLRRGGRWRGRGRSRGGGLGTAVTGPGGRRLPRLFLRCCVWLFPDPGGHGGGEVEAAGFGARRRGGGGGTAGRGRQRLGVKRGRKFSRSAVTELDRMCKNSGVLLSLGFSWL